MHGKTPEANPIGGLVGLKVLTSYFQGSVTIDIGDESQYILYVESAFDFYDGKNSYRIKGTPYDEAMLRMRVLNGKFILDACAGEDGGISIGFEDSCKLTCEADENFEAWRILGPHGFRVVSVASGGLMIWDPK